jgi:hypothetical protein
MIRLLLLTSILLSHVCWSKEPFSLFVQHELNDTDTITSIGISLPMVQNNSKVQGKLLTSLGYAEVLDSNLNMQPFMISDLAIRLGYYDKLFVYVEGGIDLLELIFQDSRNDDFYYEDNNENGPDGYLALGAGIDAGVLQFNGFVKARKIDSDNWKSEHHLFYGLQFSLTF